uniref:C25 family cysteine peptidase n=1 Tax=Candidatus Limisoma sp. TaxID=3076476 RepID=UPI004024FD56
MTKYIIAVAVGAILASFSSQAATKFKDSSVLSSGKWVKIKVGETGVYEITGEQLKQFGFSDPKKVKIFGTGGIQTTDNYNKDYTDDLEQVPAMRTGDKLYFYANGLTYEEIRSIDYTTNFDIYRSISKNAYSPASYYFLTDSEDFDARDIETVDTNESNLASVKEWRSNGVVSIWHKNDIVNPTRSGKLFLGEDFSSTKEFEITMSTPGIISGTNVVVNMSAGVKTADSQTVTLSVDGTVLDTKNVSKSADAAIYKLITSFGSTPVTEAMAQAESVTAKVSTSVSLPIAKMNYISVSYKSPLALPADSSQMRWLVKTTKESGLVIGNTTPTTHAWLVFTPNNSPYKIYNTKQYTITTSEGTSCIVPNLGTTAYAEYVIFDTGKQQKQVSFAGNVANQNLHSLATPDMLVITTPKLKAQADRIADFHRQHDGMDVEVVLQDDIFNEFGNGMRDVFAYRQLCKMLYSRNPLKFRYLLLFGSGTYDNRGIFGGDFEETLLTYQTDHSSHSVSSYC